MKLRYGPDQTDPYRKSPRAATCTDSISSECALRLATDRNRGEIGCLRPHTRASFHHQPEAQRYPQERRPITPSSPLKADIRQLPRLLPSPPLLNPLTSTAHP